MYAFEVIFIQIYMCIYIYIYTHVGDFWDLQRPIVRIHIVRGGPKVR